MESKGSANFFEDAIEKGSSVDEACQRIKEDVYNAKKNHQLPEMSDVVELVVKLSAKYPSGPKHEM